MYILIKIVNTYLWINATAISRNTRIRSTTEIPLSMWILFAHRAIKMWPAVMFADKRTDNVIGRIIWLALSIMTINWERAKGVLSGTRWLRKWFVLYVDLKIIKANQKGKAVHKVNIMWAEKVNTYGINPLILISRIKTNILVSMFVFPLLFELFIAAKISLDRKVANFFLRIRFLRKENLWNW